MTTDRKDGSDEREFLHDIATPLGTAMLLADSLLEEIQERKEADPDDVMRLGEIYKALNHLQELLVGRREILIKRGVPSART